MVNFVEKAGEMTQEALYDKVCIRSSRVTTHLYSTSFSFGIRCLDKELRNPIYAIYGFVRFADEIVDTFHSSNQRSLLQRFQEDTRKAIEEKISLNPILHSFQKAVNQYHIDEETIACFFTSMEMDLTVKSFNPETFDKYILGSAEAVGLMCLKVFCQGDKNEYQKLKPAAMKLGSAFQKVNFLRDLPADFTNLGRQYFPGIDVENFDETQKKKIEKSIVSDFKEGRDGIRHLPRKTRYGVYVAYLYYQALFKKIVNLPSEHILKSRVRIKNRYKIAILGYSYLKHQLNLI